MEAINADLTRRQGGYGRSGRQHIERDEVQFWGGVEKASPRAGRSSCRSPTATTPTSSRRSTHALTTPRPGHADLVGAIKYGYSDMRTALERSSARETAARAAAGALAKQLLGQFGMQVGSYRHGDWQRERPTWTCRPRRRSWRPQKARPCAVPTRQATEEMKARIDNARRTGDTLGGVFVVWATGLPIGLGSYVHWDRRLDGRLAWAVMSIQAIKGVEIGEAFENARMNGRDVHDQIYAGENGLERHTNRAGGLEGRRDERAAADRARRDEADLDHDQAAADGGHGDRRGSRPPSTSAPTSAPCPQPGWWARRWWPGCWPRRCTKSWAATACRRCSNGMQRCRAR